MSYYWGIDTYACPSTSVLSEMAEDGCYFLGYYLAPTRNGYRKNTSYMGKKNTILNCGVKPLPIYLASRVDDNVSADDGFQDALNAINLAAQEGFTDGTYIYLDIEQPCATGTTTERNYHAYVARWVEIIESSKFNPGIYVSATYASYFRNTIGLEKDNVRYWVYELSKFGGPYNLSTYPPNPAASGAHFASIWQCAQNKSIAFGNTGAINVDMNSSYFQNPANVS